MASDIARRLGWLALALLGCNGSDRVLIGINRMSNDASEPASTDTGSGGARGEDAAVLDPRESGADHSISPTGIGEAGSDGTDTGAEASAADGTASDGNATMLDSSDAGSILFDASDAASTTGALACTGPFFWPAVVTDFTAVPAGFAVGDLNGDGKADLVVIKSPMSSPTGRVKVALGNGNGTFGSFVDLDAGAAPATSVAIADINADGQNDLVVTNGGDGTVSVLLNATPGGAGALTFAPKVDFPAGTGATAVTVADFDADTRPDLAIASPSTGSVAVLFNSTPQAAVTPSFQTKIDVVVGTEPSSIAAADINSDGKPDLIVTDATRGAVSVLLYQTGATVTPPFGPKTDFAVGGGPAFVASGDLNADGKPDLAIANRIDKSVVVMFNTTPAGAPTPTMAAKKYTTHAAALSIAIADINADAKPDIAVAVDGTYFNGLQSAIAQLAVLVNNTPNGFALPSFADPYDIPMIGTIVRAVDLDADGRPDILGGGNSSSVSVLRNTTPAAAKSPHFGNRWDVDAVNNDIGLTTTDINRDGKPDLVTTGFGAAVLLNTTADSAPAPSFTQVPMNFPVGLHTTVAAGDLNGDGAPDLAVTDPTGVNVMLNETPAGAMTLTLADPVVFPAGEGLSGVALSDVNQDGKLDIVLANPSSGTVSIIVNSAAPGAPAPAFAPKVDLAATGKNGCGSLSPYHARMGDLNGDGVPDMVIITSCGPLEIRINTTPKGSLVPSFGPSTYPNAGGDVAMADIDGDGRLDLVTLGGSALLNTTSTGAATASFVTGNMGVIGGNTPYGVAVADLNGDGRLDITWADYAGVGGIAFGSPPQDGGVGFGSPITFAVGSEPYSVVVADFNGDKALDLAFNPRSDHSVTVLMNGCSR